MNETLKFGLGNAKLSKTIATFSLPAGHSCPFAKECLSKSNRQTGLIKDGQHCQFRCFAASQEALYLRVRKARWHNFELLRSVGSVQEKANLINRSLPKDISKVRVHVSGDYFGEDYFLAWLNVAVANPSIVFYGYTKALPHMIKYHNELPPNFRFVASRGGTKDNLIDAHNLKSAEVVFSQEEAKQKGLEIDHDDSHAFGESKASFALLIHGTQPPGTKASKALSALKKIGINGYGAKSNARKHLVNVPIHVDQTTINKYKFVPGNASVKMG